MGLDLTDQVNSRNSSAVHRPGETNAKAVPYDHLYCRFNDIGNQILNFIGKADVRGFAELRLRARIPFLLSYDCFGLRHKSISCRAFLEVIWESNNNLGRLCQANRWVRD